MEAQMQNFRTLDLAIELHQRIRDLKLKGEVRDQIYRASLSVCLNLSEGSARQTKKDSIKFFNVAFASLRETQTLIKIERLDEVFILADYIAACIYKLIKHSYSNLNGNRDT